MSYKTFMFYCFFFCVCVCWGGGSKGGVVTIWEGVGFLVFFVSEVNVCVG